MDVVVHEHKWLSFRVGQNLSMKRLTLNTLCWVPFLMHLLISKLHAAVFSVGEVRVRDQHWFCQRAGRWGHSAGHGRRDGHQRAHRHRAAHHHPVRMTSMSCSLRFCAARSLC